MKVQRVRLPETEQLTWLVLDDDYRPVEPILAYLKFLDNLERSPNTIRAIAQHLKTFWTFLQQRQLDWKQIDVTHLAAYVRWLRCPDLAVVSIEPRPIKRTNATIDQMLGSVYGFYEFQMRLKAIPDLPLYRFVMLSNRRYKSFLHGIAKDKSVRSRVVKVKREQRRPKTLTSQQVQELLDACTRTRDRFLLALLFSSGIRIGQALGLRHEALSVEDGEIHIVPRDDNPNGARAKTHITYTIPEMHHLMPLYIDYLVNDLGALKTDTLPDFVFVNIWEGNRGHPMTYDTVRSWVRRLAKKTGISFTPHMLRHSRATLWLRDDQLPPETVSRLLGHTSTQTTQNTYLHLTKEDLKKALTKKKDELHEGDTD